ncbi:MAG: Hpt domain-containing protein [Butyrivibrio sp.]|nr:Hpt domain-containing protein [Butyrivibrio sp.]
MDEFISVLKENGVDTDGALERFMNNAAMYKKFLGKFANDPNYEALKTAVEAGDCQKAFTAAHTLKGVCSNLSLTPLFEAVAKQTELFRADKFDEGAALMPQVDEAYRKMSDLIASIQ